MFLDRTGNSVSGEGPRSATIAIVADAPTALELSQRKPFIGPSGRLLDQALNACGLIRSELYITYLKKDSGISIVKGKRVSTSSEEQKKALWTELEALPNLNVVLALGPAALAALTNPSVGTFSLYRGYILDGWNGTKIIPSIDPISMVRGQQEDIYLLVADINKALSESKFHALNRPQWPMNINPSLMDIRLMIERIRHFGHVSFDIEIAGSLITCIGLAAGGEVISIPLSNSKSLSEEAAIWRLLNEVFSDPGIAKIAQNGIFDMSFLYRFYHIRVVGPILDTMVLHHIVYSDHPKGLGFLGSLYGGSQAYWKDMAKSLWKKEA